MSTIQVASCQIDAPIPARPRLLRAVLWANAAFSILSGVFFLVAPKEISALAGIPSKEDVRIIGVSVLVFAGIVIRTASRKVIRPRAVWPLVEGDVAWIVATAILMAFHVFSPAGNWLFGECACIVLLLALGEFLGLRRLRMWTAPLILVVAAVGAVFWTEANAFADLRPTSWKHNEPSTQDMSKGREILAKAAERHGAAALRAFHVMDYVALDRWSESFPAKSWWPARVQRVRHELLLGTFTSRAELLDGPGAGEIWGIQTWSPYKCRPGNSVPHWLSRDPAIKFYLPTLQYFAELPFRLAAAQNVAWAGERVHRGDRFDVVLATWGGFAPHARDDQYEIWISRQTGLVEMAQYTLREALPFATGTIHFEDYRSIQNVMVPFRNTVTLWRPASGAEREQIAKIVAELASLERQIDRAREAMAEMDEIQADIDRWIAEAQSSVALPASSVDLSQRKAAFLDALRKYLIELQHSEVNAGSAPSLSLDELYVPYLDTRRLRSLGSASDHSRLTMAYALGLAAAGTRSTGLHPGLVLLDEPLQQNPDPKHRSRFMQFLGKDLARTASFQTIIFTSLRTDEVTSLRKHGVSVQTPPGKKWLQLLPVPAPPSEPQGDVKL